ncbi:NAD(+) diphosphatase [Geomonas sp. RF6]|uniref:NAD(+) diphosphatase n=1 Tax=Geomonas sp. RF6 TaxID=2897342 RepID=UPI001E5F7288|nr:NAD(+) diphosphatase [Geomonas sp. RF6]UFS70562.1 NAD(+) diphosphatase [Geomonas sp. RF6]
MTYPAAVNLPFNGEIISRRFTQKKPGELSDPGAGYWVILQGETLLLHGDALYCGDLPESLVPLEAPLLFGVWDDRPVRVVTVDQSAAAPEPLHAVPLIDLPDDVMSLVGLGRQILHWERMSRRCSRCGSDMERIDQTWGKQCLGCGHHHFPHIHPCIIVLVRRGDEFLLGRKPEWPEGRYSLVAGFVDFGESLEECVEREVLEEMGVRVTNVRYVGSQSWPFPTQLMTGFVAEYASGEVVVDGLELEDARWFTRESMPLLPPSRSIARWIIDHFA